MSHFRRVFKYINGLAILLGFGLWYLYPVYISRMFLSFRCARRYGLVGGLCAWVVFGGWDAAGVPLVETLAAPVRIAVLAGEGERAPKAGMIDLLMVELSKHPDVVVLEREAIGKILAEQKLSLAGLTDHAHAVRLGLLLGADALLAVERLGQDQDESRQYRAKVIEAQTGLVAGDRFFNGPKVEQKPAIMATDMDRSLAWLRIPSDRRRYVAVLGYSAEQRREALTDLPVALGALIESRLALSTNVLVVDREYLRHLQTEQDLTGLDRQLALSSYLIEGLIRPSAPPADHIDVQTRVHPLQRKADLPALRSQGSVDDVSAMAHEVVSAILRQIDADPVVTNAIPATQEAARLASHAQALQRYGDTAQALPLLESAYVLDHKPGTALALAETIKALAVARAGTTNALPETEKQELLTSFLRAIRLSQIEMDQRLADSRGKKVPFGYTAVHILGPVWLRLRSVDSETSRLYRELRQQKEACRQRETEYTRKMWPRSTGYHWSYVLGEVNDIRDMSDDAAEYVAQMKQLMASWLDMPGYISPDAMWMLLECPTYHTLRDHIPARFLSTEGVAELLAWCDWISRQPSLHFKMASLYYKALICRNVDSAQYEQYAVPTREMVGLYPEFLARYGENQHLTGALDVALSYLLYHRDEWKAQHTKVYDAIVACLDRRSFVEWFNGNGGKAGGTMKLLDEKYQLRWLEAAAARLPPPHLSRYRNDLYQAAIDSTYEEIEKRRLELSHKYQALTPAISPYWQAYQVESIELGAARRPDEHLKLCKRVGDRLVLVWMASESQAAMPTFRVEVCNLEGRPIKSFPPFTQNSPMALVTPLEPRDVALDDEHAFVAVGAAGLLVFSRSEARLYGTLEGLPQAALGTVAVAGNKVIVGFDADYLGAFDPLTGHFEEIAYSRSLLKRNPLDGCRQRFAVRSLASDPDRACVWITTLQPTGVWRLSWPDDQINQVGPYRFDTLRTEDDFVLGSWQASLTRYDPETARWAPVPLYCQFFYLDPLHVMLGSDVISAGTAAGGSVTDGGGTFTFHGKMGLYLHKRVAREAFHLPLLTGGQPTHINFLVKTSDRTALAGTRTGVFWRLTKPENATPEEEALASEERKLDAFIAAQTNRVAAQAVAASSTAASTDATSYGATNLCDDLASTCWAAATNEAQGAWVEIELERPAWISSLCLVNGWVPNEKQLTLYPINHRVKQFEVATDTGEKAVLEIADHNDPQVHPLAFRKPVRRLRLTVTAIYESEVIDPEDPPWLNISEITFFENRKEKR